MLNFTKADTLRILKKKSYLVLTAIAFLINAVTLIIVLAKNVGYVDIVAPLMVKAAMLLIGVPVFIGVFTDDFNSKAMQTIIGFGTSRKNLVISRYCEYLVIMAQAFALIALMSFIMFAVTGNMAESGPLFTEMLKGYIIVALSVCASMIVVYGAQSTTFGLVVFIALVADLLDLVLMALSFIPFLSKHNIDPALILPTNMLREAMDNGKPVFYLVAAVCYIVIPLILSIKLFEKKELEL